MATVSPAPAPPPPPSAAPAVRALACPNCGGAIELRAAGLSVSLICPHCGSTLDATQGDLKLLVAAQAALKKPRIPLGTRGRLDGIDWEVVGYMERSTEDGGWAEFLLFNPYRGYRWLVTSDGSFSLGRVLDRAPTQLEDCAAIGSLRYELVEEPYPAQVDFVVGEFPWRVRVGETVAVTDYEAPGGRTLSAEASGAERTWTLSERLPSGLVAEAFGVQPTGAAARSTQSPYGAYLKPLWKMAAAACVVLLLVQMIGRPSGTPLLRRDVALTLDAPEQTIVVGQIAIDRAQSAVTVHSATAGLQNSWVDLDYSLVDRATQARYDAYGVAEEYHGSSSGEGWQEGNAAPDTRFAGIPRGAYDLVLEASAHRWAGGSSNAYQPVTSSATFSYDVKIGDTRYASTPPPGPPPPRTSIDLRVSVRQGATFEGNFWIAALLLALWPLYALWRHIRFIMRPSGAEED